MRGNATSAIFLGLLSRCLFGGCDKSQPTGNNGPAVGNTGPALDAVATAQKDLEKMQGERKAEKVVWHGQEEPADKTLKWSVWFDGSTMMIREAGRVQKSEVTLDPSKKPAAIDMKPEREKSMLGIYRIDGDTLTICFNELGRPGGFEFNKSQDDPGLNLFVLKRKK